MNEDGDNSGFVKDETFLTAIRDAAAQYRAVVEALVQRHMPEVRPQIVADVMVQAFVNESLFRHGGAPLESLTGLCRGLTMIVVQTPDPVATTGEIAARILHNVGIVRTSMDEGRVVEPERKDAQ